MSNFGKTMGVLIASIAMLSVTLVAPAQAATAGCHTTTARWEMKDGRTHIADMYAHLQVCNDSRGRLTTSDAKFDAPLTGMGRALQFYVNLASPYQESSDSTSAVYRVNGVENTCIGFSFMSLCGFTQHFHVNARVQYTRTLYNPALHMYIDFWAVNTNRYNRFLTFTRF